MDNLELTDINNDRLNEKNKTKDYFNNEINEGKDIIKKLNKYIVSFDYLSIIWYVKYSFTRYNSRYTNWYCGCFFDFNFYDKYWRT